MLPDVREMTYTMQEYKSVATRLQNVSIQAVADIAGYDWTIVGNVKKQRKLVTPEQLQDIRQALERMGK